MSGNYTVPGAAPAGAAPASGYYSRPDLWADAQKHQDDVEASYLRLKHLEGGLQTQTKNIEGMTNSLRFLQRRLQLAEKAGDTAQMESIKLHYDEVYSQLRRADLAYAKSYGDYERAYSGYQTAWNAQNTYMTGQKSAEQQWRSTIRDPETVLSELAAIEGQIAAQRETDRAKRQAEYEAAQKAKPWHEKLAGYIGEISDTTLPTYSAQGASAGPASPELKALVEKQKMLQEEYEWAMYLPYADLMQKADFAEKSQYKPLEKKEQSTMNLLMDNYSDEASPWDDPLYEAINGNKKAIGWLRSAGSNYYGPNNAIGAYFGGATEGKTEIKQMTADEISIFNYLRATEGSGAALAYFNYLQDDLNYRERKAEEEYWKAEAQKNPWGTSAFSVAMSPLNGLSYVGQLSDYIGDGKIDQNAAYNKFSYTPSAIREQVAEDIKASAKTEFWGGVGSFGYQTAMSMADFLTTTLVSGGNSTLAMAIMGSGAAADTVIDAKDRGLNDNQAFALGTIAGVAEAVTEKFSLDALLDKTSLGKSAAGYIFKNVLAEGSEEVASSLINTMADVLISQDKSQWQQSVDAYVAQGKTEGQAFGLALADQAIALGLDFLGGAFSGGVMAGGNVAINKGTTALANRQNQKQQTVPQGAAEVPAAAAPASFQEEVQRQLAENLGGKKAAQGATAHLAAPTVQVSQDVWQQGQRLAQITGRNIKFYEGKASENGFFDPKTGEIWVNAKGGDPLAQVFSHELTHSIEQAGVYGKLSSLVLNRMQDAGMDLDTAREAKRQQYQRQGKALPTQTAVDQELVAEYVSKHLLTDEAAIQSLVQQDRSLGQKIHDFFDRLLAKLGNKNAQERAFLSRAKNIYAKALRQTQAAGMGAAGTVQTEAAQPAGKSDADVAGNDFLDNLDAQLAAGEITEEEYDGIREEYERWQEEQYSAGERKYSIGKTVDNKPFVIVENDILDGVPESEWAKTVKDNLKQKFPHGVTVGRNQIQIDAQSRKELTYSGYTKWLRHNDPNAYGDKLRATDNADEILSASTDWTNEGANHSRSDKMQNFARGKVLIRVGGNDYNAEVIVGTEASGKMRLYDILNLQATQITEKEMVAATTENPSPGASRNTATISEETVSHDSEEVKRQYSLGEEAKIDSDYMDAVSRGDTETAQKMVDEAAKEAGYNSPILYHGTRSFGFTEFDLSKMDDKRSIFLTDNERIAATYSGVMGKRNVSGEEMRSVDTLSAEELVEELNSEQFGSAADPDDKTQYTHLSLKDVNALIGNVNSEIDALREEVPKMIRQYADRMAADFDSKDHRTHEQLVQLDKMLGGYDYRGIPTQLYMLLHYTDAFNGTAAEASKIAKLEQDIRLMNKLAQRDNSEGAIVESWLNGYSLNVLDTQQARDKLAVKRKTGNYGLYAKLGKALVIDADGAVWNDIRRWYHALGITVRSTQVERRGDSFALIDRASGEEIAEGRFAVNPSTESVPTKQLHAYMVDKAQAMLSIVTEDMNNTRDIAAFAQKRGYDSVIFRNLRDNGGHNSFVGTEEQADIYVLFDPSQAKSADPVTYDNDGNVIPLSERFNSGRNDIRYSLADEAENVSEEKSEVDAPEAKPDLRSSMPRKAAEMLKRTERELLWAIADRLSVPKLVGREYLTPIIQEMADEYLEKGSISPETRQLLFEKAYAQAVIVDAEFYEQYKHIKDHLRTTPVTISDRDKLDIADFNDFRKRAFGSLKIVNEGGLPVDAAYQELQSMAPELFPESITHPADQLVRMFDASRSIQVTEKTVQDYFGKYEPEYRKGAQSAFEEAIAEATGKLWEVKRFAEEKIAKEKEPAPATEQEAMEAYKKLKQARRDYEKVSAKNLLTESDQMQVGRLLRHEILPEDLKAGKDNVKGILAVFQAKQEYEHLCKLVAEYKRHLRGKARAEADELLKTANSWKDKKVGIAYSRETMERNVLDIIEDKALAQQVIDKYFAPVHTAEAASTRFKQDYRDRVRSMNISRKVQKGNLVSEAYAVQLLGEAQDNLRMLENARGRIKQRDGKNRHEWQAVIDNLWAENPLLDREKIEWAVREFRFIYDKLFQQMNQVRVANGYEPVNYRQGYFPHFQAADSDSILAQFGRALGIDTRIDALPTTINGMTHAFKPGIQWFGNAQERLGFETAYDAVEGFDKYIEGVANVIHHTQNIQNLRAFSSQIRYRTSDEGIRKQVDEVYQRQGLTDEEKQQLITEIYTHGKFTLSGFVAELDEYTNLLAGKKSRYDRAIEAAMGRKAYSVLKAWESRVAANMIAGNLTSALTNFIPWTQAGAQVGYIRLLRGVEQTLRATRSDDGFAGGSTFLTNRRGVDPLVQTWAQKASGIASKPMELIDSLVSESIVRAAYEQNRQQGLSEAEAMAQADAFAAGVMADRSKGSTPTLFHSTNPLMKAFTQFQLEVNNQFSEVFKDIPRRYRDKKLRELVWVLLKYFLGAWLYNWLYEKLIGRRPALDPIGMLCQFGEDWKEDGLGTAGTNLASDALGQLPFASGLTLIGVETDGGRLPASSAVMDLTAIWKAATTEGWSAKRRWKDVQDELNKLVYVVPPFGGNQVGKIYKGLKAYFQGGSYSVDSAGNEVLQYPVYKDNPGDAFASFVKATILGKSALGTAQEWVDKGFNSLGAKQTAAYQDMLEAGVSDREAYELIRQISDAKETDTMKKAAVQRDVLRKSQASGDGKAIAYYGLMASEKEWAIMDRLADMGADAGAVTDALMDMADVRAKDGSKQADVLAVISKAVLTDEEKAVLVGSVIGTEMLTEEGNLTQYAKFDYAVQNGMGVDQYIQYRASGASIDDYLELRDAGATVDDAMEAAMALQELKDSVEDPTTVQKWKAVMAGVSDPQKQMISLSVVMTDSQYAKLTTARGFGVSPADFVSANEKIAKYDRDGNGRLTQAEVTQGISNLRLTTQQKAVLWQLITGSSSAKNNPYSQAIGERVIAALEKAKTEGKKPGHSFQDEIMRQIMANMNP